ncbi:GAF domain-containing protein [Nocardioides sp. zg-536]|uniref:GAF domain-containing protein n=1 Tax=Nocardioides faecalis TaxID=2803858 RepID=A0A938Y3K0_9ACTN|nr:histidine kinase [Nocardioides faecalis]MBM9461567.1 GAF domain-containing protein [Nocardioides faecalis]MBS4752523.1 GAF domain-containing protein [Nocardioides faecalis]QVI57799.1 GAF domain-containing protein [Nocardioides faecalis]
MGGRPEDDQTAGPPPRSDRLPAEETLDQVVRVAAELTGARFGALVVEAPGTAGAESQTPWLHAHGDPTGHEAVLETLMTRGPALVSDGPVTSGDSLSVPVTVGGRVLGTLLLAGKRSGSAFLERDGEVAAALTGIIATSLSHARLGDLATRRGGRGRPAEQPRSDAPDDTAWRIVADWALELSGADVAWVVSGADAARLHLRAVAGLDTDPSARASVDFTTSLSRCATVTGRPLRVRSIFEHSRAVDVSAALGGAPMASAFVLPLYTSSDEEAALTIAWADPVDPDRLHRDAALPRLLADQAPLVLRVARIHQDERRLAVLEDRDRIARDLHDLVIQKLYAVGLQLQGVPRLDRPDDVAASIEAANSEIDETIREIRNTIFRLGPLTGATDARAAVMEVVERAARSMKIRPTVQFHGPVRSLLGPDLLADVLAVLTEALSNVARHAHAGTCLVEVGVGSEITVRVHDDGVGMETGTGASMAQSGLANLRLRAEQHGGSLDLTTSPEQGTTVTWTIPLP